MRIVKIGFLGLLVIVLGYVAAWGVPAVPGNSTAFTINTVSTQVLAPKSNNSRHGFYIQNLGATIVYARICAPNAASCAATTTTGFAVPAANPTPTASSGLLGQYGTFILPITKGGDPTFSIEVPQGEVDLISTGTCTVMVIEW